MLKDRPIFGCASLATIKEGSYLQSNDADSVVKLVDANEGRTPIKLSEILSGARLILQSSFQPLSRDHSWRILSLLGFSRACKHHENIPECTGVKEFFLITPIEDIIYRSKNQMKQRESSVYAPRMYEIPQQVKLLLRCSDYKKMERNL